MDGYIYFDAEKIGRILGGQQTEARVPVRAGDTLRDDMGNGTVLQAWAGKILQLTLRVGGTYAVVPWRMTWPGGGEFRNYVRVTSLHRERLADVDNAAARRNGYRSRADFMRAWGRDYWSGDEISVWVIGLEVVRPAQV